MSDIATSVPPSPTLQEAIAVVDRLMAERDAKLAKEIQWLNESTPQAPGVLDAKIARRNQVLFSLAMIELSHFRYADIEAYVRQRFPVASQGEILNVAPAMAELAGGTDDHPTLLKRNPKGDAYMLQDPIYRAAILARLRCNEGSEVVVSQLAN